MEMGGNFCQIFELGGGTTIKGRRVHRNNYYYLSNRDRKFDSMNRDSENLSDNNITHYYHHYQYPLGITRV